MMTNPSLKRDYTRLDAFIKARENDIGTMDFMYGKNQAHHSGTMEKTGFMAIDVLKEEFKLGPGSKVVDVGCGDGRFLQVFHEMGCDAVGTTIKIEPMLQDRIDKHGLRVVEVDQSFMEFEPESFDFVYARHILEHSIFPFFTLSEYNRILKPEGTCYIEVPNPGTATETEKSLNHYAVHTPFMWKCLIARAGFDGFEWPATEFVNQDQVVVDSWSHFFLTKKRDVTIADWNRRL